MKRTTGYGIISYAPNSNFQFRSRIFRTAKTMRRQLKKDRDVGFVGITIYRSTLTIGYNKIIKDSRFVKNS